MRGYIYFSWQSGHIPWSCVCVCQCHTVWVSHKLVLNSGSPGGSGRPWPPWSASPQTQRSCNSPRRISRCPCGGPRRPRGTWAGSGAWSSEWSVGQDTKDGSAITHRSFKHGLNFTGLTSSSPTIGYSSAVLSLPFGLERIKIWQFKNHGWIKQKIKFN